MTTLSSDLRLDPGTPADAVEVAALAIAADVADLGEADYDEAEAASDLADDGLEWWLAHDPGGRLLGYFWTGVVPGHDGVDVEVIADPVGDPRLGPVLLDRAVARARERAPGRVLHAYVPAGQTPRGSWLAAAGGRVVRRFTRMVIDLDDAPPPAPAAPAGVTVTRAPSSDEDLRAVHHVVVSSFSDHFGSAPVSFEEWLPRQVARAGHDPRLWWLARVDGEPAAALLGREMADLGWVQTLGTLAAFRGRGLGTHLLHTAFAAMHERGWRRIGLGVDTENVTGALRLYESVGMRPTLQWDTYELPS